MKGLAISAATLLSGMVWAMVIIHGSALAPHLEILGYVITGIVAFLMCIQAKHLLLSFVPWYIYRRMCDVCRAGELEAGFTLSGAWVGVWLRDEKQWSLAGSARC